MIRGEDGRPIVPLNLWMNRDQIEVTIAALAEHADRVDMIDDGEEAALYRVMISDLIQAFEDIRQRHDDDQEEERERRAAGIPPAGLPGHQEQAQAVPQVVRDYWEAKDEQEARRLAEMDGAP